MKKLLNPDNGAPIKDRYTLQGKVLDLDIPVGKTVSLPEEVADYLLNRFGFLRSTEETAEIAKIDGLIYCKNGCGYSNKYKVAVIAHERSCQRSEVEINEVKMMEVETDDVNYAPTPGLDADGVEWYGGGLEEDRGTLRRSSTINSQGNFGAA